MEAVIFIGIPATGKSRFFKERFVDTHIRINLDMLKTRHREEILFKACLEGKAKVVIDNTNVTLADRQRYIQPAKKAGFKITGYFFQSRLELALYHNSLRSGGFRVQDVGVHDMSKRLQIPAIIEGFDELFFVSHEENSMVVENWRL